MGLLDLFGGDSTSSSVSNTTTTTTQSYNTNLSDVVNLSNVGNPSITLKTDPVSAGLQIGQASLAVAAVLIGLYILSRKE